MAVDKLVIAAVSVISKQIFLNEILSWLKRSSKNARKSLSPKEFPDKLIKNRFELSNNWGCSITALQNVLTTHRSIFAESP